MEELDLEKCKALFVEIYSAYDDPEDNEYDILETIADQVKAEGKRVFLLEWEGGFESVYACRGSYFADSTEYGMAGPFELAAQALECYLVTDELGRVCTNEMTLEVESSLWTFEKLLLHLNLEEYDQPETIRLNGRLLEVESLVAEQKRLQRDFGMDDPQ